MEKVTALKSTGNVYEDLKMHSPEVMKKKAEMAMTAKKDIERVGIEKAVELTEFDQQYLEEVCRGNFRDKSAKSLFLIHVSLFRK